MGSEKRYFVCLPRCFRSFAQKRNSAKIFSCCFACIRPLRVCFAFHNQRTFDLEGIAAIGRQAWDKLVPDKIKYFFEDWNSELPLVSTFKIHRSILIESQLDCSHELHVFVDASQSTMCAVEYLRSIQFNPV